MAWPMPDQEIVHSIARSSNGSISDMISTFDQTRVDPKEEKYATIINHMGVLQNERSSKETKMRSQRSNGQFIIRSKTTGVRMSLYVDDGTIYDHKPGMTPYEHYFNVSCGAESGHCRADSLTAEIPALVNLFYGGLCSAKIDSFLPPHQKFLVPPTHGILTKFRKFYLSRKKTEFFVDMINEGMDVLGRQVQNDEISIAKPRVGAFITLRSPTSFQELGKDLGMYNC